MVTKAQLNEIRKLIDEGENLRADSIIQELLEENPNNYLLYVFGAKVADNLYDTQKAKSFYRKAIDLDPNKILAWQGLYRLVEGGEFDRDFSLQIIEKLISFGASEEKLNQYNRTRRSILIKFKSYKKILAEFNSWNDIDSCKIIINDLVNISHKYSEDDYDLCRKCFDQMSELTESDFKWRQKRVIFEIQHIKEFNVLHELIVKEMRHNLFEKSIWMRDLLQFVLCINYMNSRAIDIDILNWLKKFQDEGDFENVITMLQKGDLGAALAFVEGQNLTSIKWPLCGLFACVFNVNERYEEALPVINLNFATDFCTIDEMIRNAVALVKVEALYGIHMEENMNECKALLDTVTERNASLWLSLNLSLLAESFDGSVDEFTSHLDKFCELNNSDRCYWIAVFARNLSFKEAKIEAAKAYEGDQQSYKKAFLYAKLLLEENPRDPLAVSLIIKSAKTQPYSSEVFFYLGRCLFDKNRNKAGDCLKRALKIRPQYLEAAKLYDKLLQLESKKDETIIFLQNFTQKSPNCVWARNRLALLELDMNKADEAVENILFLIRQKNTDQDYVLWNILGDAYKLNGNVQSAIRAYIEALKINENYHSARIQLIQVYFLVNNLLEAFKHCEYLSKSSKSTNEKAQKIFYLLHLECLLRMANQGVFAERFKYLNRFFEILDEVLSVYSTNESKEMIKFITIYKLVGDALMLAVDFHKISFRRFNFPMKLKITNPLEAVNNAVNFYWIFLKSSGSNSPSSWNDLAIALLRKCKLSNNLHLATRAVECFKRAILLCNNMNIKSIYWMNLSLAFQLLDNKLLQQHCIVRALQINKSSGRAWCLLGLFYFQLNKFSLCRKALEMARKYDVDCAETWCLLALLAEKENQRDASDLFRHSLLMKPTEIAIKKYSHYALSQVSECPTFTKFDFGIVAGFYGISTRDEQMKFSLAVLAEIFYYLPCAAHYISKCIGYPDDVSLKLHQERISLKASLPVKNIDDKLKAYNELRQMDTSRLYDLIIQHSGLYRRIFENSDPAWLQALLSDFKPKISLALLISYLIHSQKELSEKILIAFSQFFSEHRLLAAYISKKDIDFPIVSADEDNIYHDNLTDHLVNLLEVQNSFVPIEKQEPI